MGRFDDLCSVWWWVAVSSSLPPWSLVLWASMSLKDAVAALRSLKAELEATRRSKLELEVAHRGLVQVCFSRILENNWLPLIILTFSIDCRASRAGGHNYSSCN